MLWWTAPHFHFLDWVRSSTCQEFRQWCREPQINAVFASDAGSHLSNYWSRWLSCYYCWRSCCRLFNRFAKLADAAHCQNSLKQIATALFIYHDSHGTFPQGGWGHEWVGVPERGSGQRQPGGWIYRLLPHIEESALHDLGLGADGNDASDLYSKRLGTPISLFVCPSRRACATWQIADQYPYVRLPKPYGAVLTVARADYAINAGASYIFSFRGPADLVQGDDPQFWKNCALPQELYGNFPSADSGVNKVDHRWNW